MNQYKLLGCPDCNSNVWTLINEKTFKDPRYNLITVQLRQCAGCNRRYRVAKSSNHTFYYS